MESASKLHGQAQPVCKHRLHRSAAAALLACLFFLITAAPGSGGRGGGGGGRLPAPWSRVGGYGGHSGPGGGELDGDQRRVLAIIVVLTVIGAWVVIYVYYREPRATHRRAHLLFRLTGGERYLPELDELLRTTRFGSPRQNRRALEHLARLLDAGHVSEAAFSHDRSPSPSAAAARDAEGLFWAQMKAADLTCTISDLPPREGLTEGAPVILGVVATVKGDARELSGGKDGALRALRRLARNRTPEAVYVYYAPEPGEHLTARRAAALYRKLLTSARHELQAG